MDEGIEAVLLEDFLEIVLDLLGKESFVFCEFEGQVFISLFLNGVANLLEVCGFGNLACFDYSLSFIFIFVAVYDWSFADLTLRFHLFILIVYL